MNKEVFDKVSKCSSVDEVLELAKANGKDITREQAEHAYNMAHNEGELGDDEMANVAGGAAGCDKNNYENVYWPTEAEVQFIFNIGDKVEIFASMNPAKEVGGDFYDFYWIDDDHLALCIADVSGKGVPAALFMVVAKTCFRNACKTFKNADDILKNVNQQLCENNKDSMFVTAWVGILEVSSGKMRCANAGHEYPVLARFNGQFELIKDKHGFPLAAIPGASYVPYDLKLEKNDVLFVYTDGLPEANNVKGDMLGLNKMVDI